MIKLLRSTKGSALVVTVAVLMILMILGTALISISLAEVKHGMLHERTTQAHYVSVAAAEGVAEYIIGNQFDNGIVADLISDLEAGGTEAFPNSSFTNNNFANGTFDVAVSGEPGKITIESTGDIANQYQRTNTLLLSNSNPSPFWGQYAVASKTIIEAAGGAFTVNGNVMSNGPQSLTDSQLNNVSGNKDFNADQPFPKVKYPFENFIVDYDNKPANEITVEGGISGSYTFNHTNIYHIGTGAQGHAINLGGSDDLTFNTGSSGQVTFLNLQGNLRQGGSSGITFLGSGQVIFFVDGSIDLFGGAWNQTGFSGDVIFFVPKDPPDDPDRTINLSGNTSYHAHIIAPDVNMTYNGGGSNWFTGMTVVNYFKGHGNFKVLQDPIGDSDLNDLIEWPWSKVLWQ